MSKPSRDETDRLVAEFQARQGQIRQLDTIRGLRTLTCMVLSARERITKGNKCIGSYIFVRDLNPIHGQPETFGIAGRLADLEPLKIGQVFCFPVESFAKENQYTSGEHNILFRLRGRPSRPRETSLGLRP